MTERVIVMYLGRVVEEADVDTIFYNPKQPYTQALLRSIPRLGRKAGILRESFHAPGILSKAMFYGFPAIEAGGVLMDKKDEKGKRLGEALGGAALGMAAWKPFGMVGSIAADRLGRDVGGSIGGGIESMGRWAADKVRTPAEPPQKDLGMY